ncbi:MAG: VanZ family protein [Pyrinomonadaceae bacterium]|nr:VanZ family protein [Pyrinomonadaceae bacterium]
MAFFRDENFWLYAPLIVWISGIFYLSSNRGSMSNTLPYFITLNKLLFSRSDAATLRKYHFIIRKTCHFFGYAILALLASVVFYNSSLPSPAKFWHVCAFAIVLVVASADEIRQSFYPERNGSLSDVALDCLGGLTMILLFWLFAANLF